MELVKELPEIFEEFAEQRQRSFLTAFRTATRPWDRRERPAVTTGRSTA